eukprot:CAMPEP_0171315950 /NCGR_PEP_ID=MMETSP0816-20121228/68488_1 /TAXON_ID=420281 /ORGANISM="Proboscia inermis, Strain CCAP1064/1" /LENGTH=69 /DNA_ID=CAMNT_0011807203 /DNA_START=38 /DNA_END=244 /DNA_ORIENTATION=+
MLRIGLSLGARVFAVQAKGWVSLDDPGVACGDARLEGTCPTERQLVRRISNGSQSESPRDDGVNDGNIE